MNCIFKNSSIFQEIQSDETNSNARPKQKKRVHWPDDMDLSQCFVYDPNIWEIDEEKKGLQIYQLITLTMETPDFIEKSKLL